MRLLVQINASAAPGPSQFAAHRVSLERRLGEPVLWKFILIVAKERGEDAKLARALEAGPCTAQSSWAGQHSTPFALSLPSRIVGARWLDQASGMLELTGTTTSFPDGQNATQFLPRRTVHHVRDYLELGQRFSHIAEPGVLENLLARRRFPEGERVCIVQDGCSDWDFFAAWLNRCANLLGQSLLLTGATQDDARSPWVITSGSAKFYRELGDVPNRTVPLGGPDDVTDIAFETWESLVSGPSLPRNDSHVVGRIFPARKFSRREWDGWRQRDIPLFGEGGRVMFAGVRDHLSDGGGESPVWVTELLGLPAENQYAPLPPGEGERPWVCVGEVEESSPTAQWIKVRLADFAGRYDNNDVVWVRASTPYSGSDGAQGLHLIPSIGTPLAVAWSGRWGEPVFAFGNVRYKDAATAAPSLTLESAAKVSVGEVEIESAKVALQSQGEVTFDADGVRVSLSGGKFKTGT